MYGLGCAGAVKQLRSKVQWMFVGVHRLFEDKKHVGFIVKYVMSHLIVLVCQCGVGSLPGIANDSS